MKLLSSNKYLAPYLLGAMVCFAPTSTLRAETAQNQTKTIEPAKVQFAGDDVRFVVSRDNQYVLDITTGLVWTRCRIGGTFQNGACNDSYRFFTRKEATEYLNSEMPQWRIPSTVEFASLVKCGSRKNHVKSKWGENLAFDEKFGFFFVPDGNRRVTYPCSKNLSPPIDAFDRRAFGAFSSNMRPNTRSDFWTSSSSLYEQASLYSTSPELKYFVFSSLGGIYFGRENTDHSLVLVTHESEFQLGMGFSAPVAQSLWPRNLGATLVWKSTLPSEGEDSSTRVILDKPRPTLDRQLLAVMSGLINRQMDGSAVVVPPEPVRDAYTAKPNSAPKGEFETSAAYAERVQREAVDAQRRSDASYQQALNDYQSAIKRRDERGQQYERALADPEFYRKKLQEAWQALVPVSLGNPELTDIRYDADRQVFTAMLRSTRGFYDKEIVAAVPLNKAEKVKADLLSGKIAPQVEFEFPSMAVSWSLVENDSLRASKFGKATTVEQLEALIREYPSSTEAKSARSRIFVIPSTSKQLAAVIERNKGWPEAATAFARLRQLQQSEFLAARKENSSYAYDSFVEAFGGADTDNLLDQARKARAASKAREAKEQAKRDADWERSRPARESRERAQNLCRAQVQTCIASCPRWINSSGERTDWPEHSCKSQCQSVNCN